MTTSSEPFYIVGPTGCGKSSVALTLAERWNGEIVNADAFQVYEHMPIITGAPSAADRARVPHHLYGIVPVEEDYNVARYAASVEHVIQEIQSRGRHPMVVGGSGLYVKALTHGLAESPPGDASLRHGLHSISEDRRVRWLERLDPVGARRTNLRNPRYVMRALEITLLSGTPASVLKADWRRQDLSGVDGVLISRDREDLYGRINRRVEEMFAAGAVAEVSALPPTLSTTASKAIGVGEIRRYLRGDCTLAEAVEAIRQATRRYAKRQETWFRREPIFRRLTESEALALALSRCK